MFPVSQKFTEAGDSTSFIATPLYRCFSRNEGKNSLNYKTPSFVSSTQSYISLHLALSSHKLTMLRRRHRHKHITGDIKMLTIKTLIYFKSLGFLTSIRLGFRSRRSLPPLPHPSKVQEKNHTRLKSTRSGCVSMIDTYYICLMFFSHKKPFSRWSTSEHEPVMHECKPSVNVDTQI